MKKQMNFSFFEDELATKQTNKQVFLKEIDRLVPWSDWVELIKPHYYKGERGNKPYDLELMLRIYILQNLYNMSDMGAETEIIDSRAFSSFCHVSSSNQIPNGDTIGRFRNILIQHQLQEKLFMHLQERLRKEGLILQKGTITDSTLIAAPSSTNNQEKKRDSDAHQVKKGENWHFGYKAHIGVDKDSSIAHHVEVTAANVHDITMLPKLMHGTEEEVYGDSGYLGASKRTDTKKINTDGKPINYEINLRPSSIRKMPQEEREAIRKQEHKKSSIRAKVEHVFAIIKTKFGYRKTRYKGLKKQQATLTMMFALANLILAERQRKRLVCYT